MKNEEWSNTIYTVQSIKWTLNVRDKWVEFYEVDRILAYKSISTEVEILRKKKFGNTEDTENVLNLCI